MEPDKMDLDSLFVRVVSLSEKLVTVCLTENANLVSSAGKYDLVPSEIFLSVYRALLELENEGTLPVNLKAESEVIRKDIRNELRRTGLLISKEL